jgi:hypothetical protein
MKHIIEKENVIITIEQEGKEKIVIEGVHEYLLLGANNTDFSYTYGSFYSILGRIIPFIDYLKSKLVLKENA